MNRVTLLVAIIGILLITAGVTLIYRPLGLIVPGAVLLFLASLSARKKA